jgi:hypothetical protein
MIKNLFKATKVIFDAHYREYRVYYKNFLFWKYDSCYKFDDPQKTPIHYQTQKRAEERAIERATNMLDIVEVWKKSNLSY